MQYHKMHILSSISANQKLPDLFNTSRSYDCHSDTDLSVYSLSAKAKAVNETPVLKLQGNLKVTRNSKKMCKGIEQNNVGGVINWA